jgi:hypothetical protein
MLGRRPRGMACCLGLDVDVLQRRFLDALLEVRSSASALRVLLPRVAWMKRNPRDRRFEDQLDGRWPVWVGDVDMCRRKLSPGTSGRVWSSLPAQRCSKVTMKSLKASPLPFAPIRSRRAGLIGWVLIARVTLEASWPMRRSAASESAANAAPRAYLG